MSINIKNSAAEEALRRLTALTGETQATAVERSAIERIELGARRERIRLDVAEIQRLVVESGGPITTDNLYDDAGLPR